jgi:hypothetical protein
MTSEILVFAGIVAVLVATVIAGGGNRTARWCSMLVLRSALPLLVAGVLTNHPQNSAAADDLALDAYLLD